MTSPAPTRTPRPGKKLRRTNELVFLNTTEEADTPRQLRSSSKRAPRSFLPKINDIIEEVLVSSMRPGKSESRDQVAAVAIKKHAKKKMKKNVADEEDIMIDNYFDFNRSNYSEDTGGKQPNKTPRKMRKNVPDEQDVVIDSYYNFNKSNYKEDVEEASSKMKTTKKNSREFKQIEAERVAPQQRKIVKAKRFFKGKNKGLDSNQFGADVQSASGKSEQEFVANNQDADILTNETDLELTLTTKKNMRTLEPEEDFNDTESVQNDQLAPEEYTTNGNIMADEGANMSNDESEVKPVIYNIKKDGVPLAVTFLRPRASMEEAPKESYNKDKVEDSLTDEMNDKAKQKSIISEDNFNEHGHNDAEQQNDKNKKAWNENGTRKEPIKARKSFQFTRSCTFTVPAGARRHTHVFKFGLPNTSKTETPQNLTDANKEKRRTYELDSPVNDVEELKSAAKVRNSRQLTPSIISLKTKGLPSSDLSKTPFSVTNSFEIPDTSEEQRAVDLEAHVIELAPDLKDRSDGKKRRTYDIELSTADAALQKPVQLEHSVIDLTGSDVTPLKTKSEQGSKKSSICVEKLGRSPLRESNAIEMSIKKSGEYTYTMRDLTSGKRRTYELDESVTSLSRLKNECSKNSAEMSTIESISPIETGNSPQISNETGFSKVTTRRKNKPKLSKSVGDLFRFDPNSTVNKLDNISLQLEDLDSTDPNNSDDAKLQEARLNCLRFYNLSESRLAANTSAPLSLPQSTPLVKTMTGNSKKPCGSTSSSVSKSQTRSQTKSKVKVPNFAMIHQRAFDRMEGIVEHKQRKEERAKYLLSGKKPLSDRQSRSLLKRQNTIKETKSKKQLRFAPDTNQSEKPDSFVPLPTTPLPRRLPPHSIDSPIDSPLVPKIIKKIENSRQFRTPPVTPQRSLIGRKENKSANVSEGVPQNNRGTPKIKTCTIRLEAVTRPHSTPAKITAQQPRDGFNRFGFKLTHMAKEGVPGIDKTQSNRKAQLKLIINKQKVPKDDVAQRRNIIKGVRSNRRFDLLMKMRNN